MGDIPSGSELLNLLPVCIIGRAGQVHFLEFSKGGLSEKRDEFTYSGSGNQTVLFLGDVHFS